MSLVIGVDFDGTIVEHQYPRIGPPVPGALETLRQLERSGNKLVLWTMRSGYELEDAVSYLQANGVTLWGINTNPEQDNWTTSPKAECNVYIDDAGFGCPLVYPTDEGRPYVDWEAVARTLL